VDGQVHLAARLEEAPSQLQLMQDEYQAIQNMTTHVHNLVQERSSEVPSLAAAQSSTVDLIEGHVDGAAANGVH
jgi:hypothetical protein